MRRATALLWGILGAAPVAAGASTVEIPMDLMTADGAGKRIGTVTAEGRPFGTVFTPNLTDLTPGIHGFHVHQNPNCGPAEKEGKTVPGLAAGGHFDPAGTGIHAGPYGEGHLGDLPVLHVDEDGAATHPVLAPRVSVSDLRGRSLMIHAGGDNYSDDPKPLGGGGSRMACGVVP